MIALLFGNLRDLEKSRYMIRVVLQHCDHALWVHRFNTDFELPLNILIESIVDKAKFNGTVFEFLDKLHT